MGVLFTTGFESFISCSGIVFFPRRWFVVFLSFFHQECIVFFEFSSQGVHSFVGVFFACPCFSSLNAGLPAREGIPCYTKHYGELLDARSRL